MHSRIIALWRASSPRTRHWWVNIGIGVAIVSALNWASHGMHLSFVVNAQNGAFDRMMRASAAAASDGGDSPLQAKLVLVDIDDQTWRDPRWGGGEPARAPRDALATLIEGAFQRGATQVVLDVAIEGATGRDADLADDRLFAARMQAMLAAPWFGADRQLVLVRTLRPPLPVQRKLLAEASRGETPFTEGYLDELREAPPLDSVIGRSSGRIVVAAPFFSLSPDHVLRDWQLLQVVCERRAAGAEGAVLVVPSVQLAVAARHFGLAAGAAPWQIGAAAGRCTPFPADPARAMRSAEAREAALGLLAQVEAATAASWHATHQAFAQIGVGMSAQVPRVHDLGNRVVFRWANPPNVVPANELLHGQVRHDLKGRIVVIGQSNVETVDHQLTPLGDMPGCVVLLNAIDSMIRYRVIETPSAWITVPLAFAMIVVVGYAFARWNSLAGTLVATGVIIAVLPWASFSLFKHGVWLDFALPLLGIQVHKMITSLEESLARRQQAQTSARLARERAGKQEHSDRVEATTPRQGGAP